MINKLLLIYVSDADLQTKHENTQYSTSVREIITVGFMLDHPQDQEVNSLKVEKWHCPKCDITFYTEGEYIYDPYCTNCGSDTNVVLLGKVEIKEDKPDEVSSR